jgi:hypothetical protein
MDKAELKLYAGGKFTGIAVRPDLKYPSMWRIHAPDRPPSDMVNLSRAKDAAHVWAKLGGRGLAPEWRTGSSSPKAP